VFPARAISIGAGSAGEVAATIDSSVLLNRFMRNSSMWKTDRPTVVPAALAIAYRDVHAAMNIAHQSSPVDALYSPVTRTHHGQA